MSGPSGFDAALARCREAYETGKREREATMTQGNRQHGNDYGTDLRAWDRGSLTAYWLGATERDRLAVHAARGER